MSESSQTPGSSPNSDSELDRRNMLGQLGRFAAITPPSVTFLLSTTMTSGAIAKSGNNGFGNGGGDGVPGNSGFPDTNR